jgi:hypothetical protein
MKADVSTMVNFVAKPFDYFGARIENRVTGRRFLSASRNSLDQRLYKFG